MNCDSVGILAHRGNFLQLVLVAAAEQWIWIKICNLKDGGHGDKDRDIWERRGDIIIIRASSFAHKPKLSPHHPHPHTQNSLWSVVTPITSAKPSLSAQAVDLRTPHQQIGLGEGLKTDKEESLPLLLYLKSITLAFTFNAPHPPLLVSSDSGLGPTPQQSAYAESSVPFQDESHPGHTVSVKDQESGAVVGGRPHYVISKLTCCCKHVKKFFLTTECEMWHILLVFIQQQQKELSSLEC